MKRAASQLSLFDAPAAQAVQAVVAQVAKVQGLEPTRPEKLPSSPRITITPATSSAQVTREKRYASGAGHSAVNLEIYRDAGAVKVAWNINRGAGWTKGWKATRATEAEARAFADEKWPALLAWLEKVEPVEGGGAAQAFSAQIASMRR